MSRALGSKNAGSPLEYARACQLSPIIPLTEVVMSPGVRLVHAAKVCPATLYPPKVTWSCTRLPWALPEPYEMSKTV